MLTPFAARFMLTAMFPLTLDMQCAGDPETLMEPPIEQVEAGSNHTCVIAMEGTRVRCWGENDMGQLGQATTEVFGDDEPAAFGEDVLLAKFGRVLEIAAGADHTCARSSTGRVRCWGRADLLGMTMAENQGDDEVVPIWNVELGYAEDDPYRPLFAVDLATNHMAACALIDDNTVRCWGHNSDGELGLGFTSDPIGDDEPVFDAPTVPVGAPLRALEGGGDHMCGITARGNVRCWGRNNQGQLGYGHTNTIGDDDTPADAGDIDLGGERIAQLALGGGHTCARTYAGKVRCWGLNVYGQLGYGNTANVGDDEVPGDVDYVKVDATRAVIDIAVGAVHTCAVLTDGAVKCWGYGEEGQLGYGDKKFIGDDETPASAPDVPLGAVARRVTMGEHTCALLDAGKLRCWGLNYDGELGYGTTVPIGDDETPMSIGDVLVF